MYIVDVSLVLKEMEPEKNTLLIDANGHSPFMHISNVINLVIVKKKIQLGESYMYFKALRLHKFIHISDPVFNAAGWSSNLQGDD